MSRSNLKLAKSPVKAVDENIPVHLQATIKSGLKSIDAINEKIKNLQAQAQGIDAHIGRVIVEELKLDISAGDTVDVATMTYRKAAAP